MDDSKKVTIPLMVTSEDDIQFVEEDLETASDTEASPSGIKRHSGNSGKQAENVYSPPPMKEVSMNFLGIPKISLSRSVSSEGSSDGTNMPILMRTTSGKKKSYLEQEKASGASVSSRKNAIERITDGSFFRRRHEMSLVTRSDKGDDEEHILEALRHVVRKCTTLDPIKRPASTDVLDLLHTFNEKS